MGRRRGEPSSPEQSGVFVIDKVGGMSSFDVIRRLRRLLGPVKYGHAGTLDPMATGVLLVLVGRATRLSSFLMGGDKKYRAEARLGVCTDTDDLDGQVIEEVAWQHVRAEDVIGALGEQVGTISQVPPLISAIKRDGKPAYARVRAGEDLVLDARQVEVHAIDQIEVSLPSVRFDVACGKGTYIRSIARDLGERLGTKGTLASLRRLQVGPFTADDAVTLETLQEAEPEQRWSYMLSSFGALHPMPVLTVDMDQAVDLVHGRKQGLELPGPGMYRVAIPGTDHLLALLEIQESGKTVSKIFAPDWRPVSDVGGPG